MVELGEPGCCGDTDKCCEDNNKECQHLKLVHQKCCNQVVCETCGMKWVGFSFFPCCNYFNYQPYQFNYYPPIQLNYEHTGGCSG